MLGSNKLHSLAMTNIHEVLERVCSLVEAESQGGINLVRDYDPSIPDVFIDKEQMIQAVLNIVRNAMQALSGQNDLRLGRITLRTRTLRQFTIGHTRHRLVTKLEIIDNAYGNTTLRAVVTANQKNKTVLLNLKKSAGWYDFTVKLKNNAATVYRFAGHVETGKAGITDPAMGNAV